ncbi:Ketoreductase [Podosphaera aphanis]|nr:Ketoreductase [Podosphaera aphanis]
MALVLLTGGSGFLAAHILELLLKSGYSVVTTVRSHEKGSKILEAHPDLPRSKLDYRIVEDVAQPGAFDEVVKVDGLEAVIHTASPFHFNVVDTKKDLLDPAINGTLNILNAVRKNAPKVKRVVVTSSFAAIVDSNKPVDDPSITYSEKDWNSVTNEQAVQNPNYGYRASKTFAERAAWDYMQKESPNFSLATVNPPLIFGPVINHLDSLDKLNTSNQRIGDLISGKYKSKIPETGVWIWIDVRDVALAHLKAMELEEASGRRFFVTAGKFSNRDIVNIVRKNFPELSDQLPDSDVKGGDYPEKGSFGWNNSVSNEVLTIDYLSLEQCVVDTVKSLKKFISEAK